MEGFRGALYTEGLGDDRAVLVRTPVGLVAILSDGAHGMSGAAQAAESLISGVLAAIRARKAVPEVSELTELLVQQDRHLHQLPSCGEASVLVVLISGSHLRGASVGEGQAWLLGEDSGVELTRSQRRRPLVGSGLADPVGFERPFSAGTVLLGSDGFFRYAFDAAIRAAHDAMPPANVLARLLDQIRLKNGALQDDVSLVLVQRQPPEKPPRQERGVSGAGRLLVVDQNSSFVRTVQRMFLSGYALTLAESGRAAIEKIGLHPFDAVLVDYDLPDEKGDAVVLALREGGYAGPIVAISARDRGNDAMKRAGADVALSKMRFQEMPSLLQQLLGCG